MTDLYLVAGEPSADKLGAPIIRALPSHLQIRGIAGPELRKANIHGSFRMEDLQVMGLTDVALALPRLARIFIHTRNEILRLNPKAVFTIDYPGFNLRLARSLRKHGYKGKLIHAVCPTVWAWRKWRIPMMAKNLDMLLSLFPFEKDCFKNTSLQVEYIGHPLVSKIKSHILSPTFYESYHLNPKEPILALFPGSRKAVVQKNLPLQLAAAKELQSRFPNLRIVVSLAHTELRSLLKSFAPTLSLIEPADIYDLMRSTHLALATSGTITLELALFKVPTVVNYAVRPLDGFLAQKIFRLNLPHYCIVNILANRRVYPELIDSHLQADALREAAEELLDRREACIQGCREVAVLLGTSNAAGAAAEKILDYVERCF